MRSAKYHRLTQPRPRSEHASLSPSNRTRARWKRVGAVAYRAGSDDTSDSEGDVITDEQRARKREHKRLKKAEREKHARMMGLEYFLEMVDQKHRYGSNLRRYHVEWKKSNTQENYFYWLDYGEGKDLDLEDRPRKRLDSELVRYLSREERLRYLVKIDQQGRFCWAKDNVPITTSHEFKDSINGVVPTSDATPTWREVTTGEKPQPSPPSSDDDDGSASLISTGSQEDASKYTNSELHDAKGFDKMNHLSVDTLMNHLMRKTTKKNTWIFVADTSFRLYIGIKQSGAFQHSSFLHGARVSAAGLIKIKRGQLRKLSPLSGHYAPPVKSFQVFVENLRDAGADMSRCSISRSYAVLLGLEGYLEAKKHVKKVEQRMRDVVNPEEKRKREESERDGSKSAARERQVLEEQERREREKGLRSRLRRVVNGEVPSVEKDAGSGGVELGKGRSR